jgi:hypothetical protein
VTDLVYLVRRGENNPELRFSLRSLVNLPPHRRVFFVGHLPAWVRGVEHIPGNRKGSTAANVFDNLRLACEHIDADRFVIMNDDFFTMRPVRRFPSRTRGPLVDHIAKVRPSDWRKGLTAALRFLEAHGITDPLSYEAHIPVEMDRDKLAHVLDLAAGPKVPPQWRTIYGNWWHVPAVHRIDCKIRGRRSPWDETDPFVSTDDSTFRSHPVGAAIRAAFPDPSPYEVA